MRTSLDEPVQGPGCLRASFGSRTATFSHRHGGDATVVHLPELGMRGNTHFPFSDMNNVEIANLLSMFLAEKHLEGGGNP